MKTYATILILTLALFAHSAARAAGSSLEIVLSDDHVMFTTTNVSLERTFRNVGETNLESMRLLEGLSVVFDGKEYARDPKQFIAYNGVRWFQPKIGWRDYVLLSDYLIPPEKLTPGRYTVSLKVGDAVSNQLTIFVGARR